MDKKVVLILVDGMRPDGLLSCGNNYVKSLLDTSASCLAARTVFPSVTLPCHMSLFHSVDPSRHGTTTNTYAPQVRPIDGLIERLDAAGKRCAAFYTWEQLRDICQPGHLEQMRFINGHRLPDTDRLITDAAIEYICAEQPDFVFLYMGETDSRGHDCGWMSDAQIAAISRAIDNVRRVKESIPSEYDVILQADHGGHDRIHGTEMEEDMTIPVILNGPSFEAGKEIEDMSIKDIAPTIAKMLGATPAKEWEGRALI